jgi:hypothetical protein
MPGATAAGLLSDASGDRAAFCMSAAAALAALAARAASQGAARS